MTVLILERYPVAARGAEEAGALLAELCGRMREAPGLLWADVARSAEEEPSFLVQSEWRTEADAEGWHGGGEPAPFLERLDVHLRGDVTRRRFTSAGPAG